MTAFSSADCLKSLSAAKRMTAASPIKNFWKSMALSWPPRRGRKKTKTQDGRKLRWDKRRWKVERLSAWLQNFRRLAARHERHADNCLAFLQLACSVIWLRFILR
ncbi:MAG: transposase [Candidatus Electronema sp. V4]|uniref:transposase n=1 Tax=Candidatus Electronema sp. V4 TaxID=3454756 RepID=UPI0040553D37